MTKYEDLRPCIITTCGNKIPAKFHALSHWANEEGNAGTGAIVEFNSGNLVLYDLSFIQFTDHKPPEPKKEEEPQKQEEPEVTYKVGDRFHHKSFGIEYTLMMLSENRVSLYQNATPEHYFILHNGDVCVQDINKITISDLERLEPYFKNVFTLTKEDNENGQN